MKRNGFSLIEILTAMAIFMLIVVMMGNVFHQASVAWDSGDRKARGGMEVRAMLGFMAREMSQAVGFFEEDLFGPTGVEGGALAGWTIPKKNFTETRNSSITFITLDGNVGAGSRQAKRILYEGNTGPGGGSVVRREYSIQAGADYRDRVVWGAGPPSVLLTETILATNIHETVFTTSPEPEYYDGSKILPRFVTIRAGIERLHDVSGVGARSAGPDGIFGTDDDIMSE